MKIANKVLGPLIASVLILIGLIQFVYFPYLEEQLVSFEKRRHQAELSVLGPVIAEEFVVGDISKIYSVLDGYKENHQGQWDLRKPDISVITNDGIRLYPLELSDSGDAYALEISQKMVWGEEVLGHIRLKADMNQALIVKQIRFLQLAVLLVAGFALTVSIWWNRRLIIKPVQMLEHAAKEISDGNYTHKIEQASKDEFGELATSFNKMAETILKTNKALSDSLHTANQANLSKSLFLANMSHEIRTPMNAILGLSYLALSEYPDNETSDYFKKIQTSGNNLLNIINDILDFSKIEAGKLTLEHIPFDLKALIDEVYTVHKILAEKQNVSFSVDVHLMHSYVKGDPTRINQILINIISNAIKFSSDKEVFLNVEMRPIQGHQVMVEFTIRDTGIGMNESQQARLFSEFTQADTSTTRKYGGTGLGLAITSKLVGLLKGAIDVESEEGVGTTFTISIPLDLSSQQESKKSDEQELIKRCTEAAKDKRVLLVEDNLINIEVAAGMLARVGIECDKAENGEEALHMMEKTAYDLVLMDIQMPVMDGYQATMLARERGISTVIIALSANAMTQDRKKSFSVGMHDHLAKPIEPDALYACLIKWLTQ